MLKEEAWRSLYACVTANSHGVHPVVVVTKWNMYLRDLTLNGDQSLRDYQKKEKFCKAYFGNYPQHHDVYFVEPWVDDARGDPKDSFSVRQQDLTERNGAPPPLESLSEDHVSVSLRWQRGFVNAKELLYAVSKAQKNAQKQWERRRRDGWA